MPVHLPPVAHSAHLDFFERIVNRVEDPVIAHSHSLAVSASQFLDPGGAGIGFQGQQPFDNFMMNLQEQIRLYICLNYIDFIF